MSSASWFKFFMSSIIDQTKVQEFYLKNSVLHSNHYYACDMLQQLINWSSESIQGVLKEWIREWGLPWDMAEIISILLATWRQGGKTDPLSLLPKHRKKMPCGWSWLSSTTLLRGFGTPWQPSPWPSASSELCSAAQSKALSLSPAVKALIEKQKLKMRSQRVGRRQF